MRLTNILTYLLTYLVGTGRQYFSIFIIIDHYLLKTCMAWVWVWVQDRSWWKGQNMTETNLPVKIQNNKKR